MQLNSEELQNLKNKKDGKMFVFALIFFSLGIALFNVSLQIMTLDYGSLLIISIGFIIYAIVFILGGFHNYQKLTDLFLKTPQSELDLFENKYDFNPIKELKYSKGDLVYSSEIPTISDQFLQQNQIKIFVNSIIVFQNKFIDHIIFQKDDHEFSINCGHTGIKIDKDSTLKITPWTHFINLKTFMINICNIGILNFLQKFKPNWGLIMQNAIHNVAPEISNSYFLQYPNTDFQESE